jgi:hypothetical protein
MSYKTNIYPKRLFENFIDKASDAGLIADSLITEFIKIF